MNFILRIKNIITSASFVRGFITASACIAFIFIIDRNTYCESVSEDVSKDEILPEKKDESSPLKGVKTFINKNKILLLLTSINICILVLIRQGMIDSAVVLILKDILDAIKALSKQQGDVSAQDAEILQDILTKVTTTKEEVETVKEAVTEIAVKTPAIVLATNTPCMPDAANPTETDAPAWDFITQYD